jgi:hypothetical protein
MKKSKPIFLLLLVFAAGMAVGVLGHRIVVQKRIDAAMRNPTAIREKMEKELVAKLDLSPEQRNRVREILMKSHEEMHRLRMEVQPKFKEIFDQSEAEIVSTLNDEQKARFEKLVKEKRLWRPFPPPRPTDQKQP